MNFSTRLDEAMQHAGFKSQNALAKASGVSQTTINRLLKTTGSNGPDRTTIQKLASTCGVSVEWLADGIVKNNSTTPKTIDEYYVVHISPVELRIISKYRETTLAGKSLLEMTADQLPIKSSTYRPLTTSLNLDGTD